MLSAGVLLYAAGFILSIYLRQYDVRLAGAGDMVRFPWDNAAYNVVSIDAGIKDRIVKDPDVPLLDHEPEVLLRDSLSAVHAIGAYPPAGLGRAYSHILNYGIAPEVRLFKGDAMVANGYMALRLMPPGRSDYFDIQPYPFRFLVYLLPEKMHENVSGRKMIFDLKSPRYMTRVFRGEDVIAEGASDSPLEFEGFSLSYTSPKYWVQLESALDAGIPMMKSGIIMIVLALPVYILAWLVALVRFRGPAPE